MELKSAVSDDSEFEEKAPLAGVASSEEEGKVEEAKEVIKARRLKNIEAKEGPGGTWLDGEGRELHEGLRTGCLHRTKEEASDTLVCGTPLTKADIISEWDGEWDADICYRCFPILKQA